MKFVSPTPRSIAAIVVGLATLLLSTAAHAQGFFSNSYTVQGRNLDLGYAGRTYQWAVFGLNGDVSSSDTVAGTIDVVGNIGVAGTGNLYLSGSVVQGDVWLRSGGTANLSNKGAIKGKLLQGSSYDSVLNHAVQDANTLAANCSLLTPTNTAYSTINTTNQNFTIADTTGGAVVLKLTDFMLSGGTFTLQGTATTKFIINVNRYFSLSSGAKVVTSGGLLASNVLFNIENGSTSNAVLSGGSVMNAILLAANRTVSLTGASLVNGEVIGKSVLLSGSSKIKKPPVISP